jgi:isovaleryl-CoA dehydrogenase
MQIANFDSAKLYEIGAGTTEVRKIVIGRAFNKEYSNYTS